MDSNPNLGMPIKEQKGIKEQADEQKRITTALNANWADGSNLNISSLPIFSKIGLTSNFAAGSFGYALSAAGWLCGLVKIPHL